MLTADGCTEIATPLEDEACCPASLCGNDLCATFCAFFNLLPSGPMWNQHKAAAISYFQTSDDPSKCPLLKDPTCPSLVLHAIYVVMKLKLFVEHALWPALRESNPMTAVTTLDAHLDRMQWEDCYRQACRPGGGITPYEINGECGPVFCPPDFPDDLACALKHNVAIALTRASMSPIKNLCGLNWIIDPLGAELKPIYVPDSANPCNELCTDNPQFQICNARDWLEGCGSGDLCDTQTAAKQVQAYWDRGCDAPAGLPTRIWPGVLAAECLIRSLLPPLCVNQVTRCC